MFNPIAYWWRRRQWKKFQREYEARCKRILTDFKRDTDEAMTRLKEAING